MPESNETIAGTHGADALEGTKFDELGPRRVALLGNPNTGKTTLFNSLCGLRHKTSNFPGTTQEARVGFVRESRVAAGRVIEFIDLPGVYSLELDQPEAIVCRGVLAGEMAPRGEVVESPDALCVIIDATNIPRNLIFAGEVLRRRMPTVVVLTMVDLAERRGLAISEDRLAELLGCTVVRVNGRTGQGIDAALKAVVDARIPRHTPPGDARGIEQWADSIYEQVAQAPPQPRDERMTDRVDRVLTHPVLGLIVFAAIMTGLFWVIFKLATYPMDWIDAIFVHLGGLVERLMPAGVIEDLLANGVVGGVGATVIFLPQIVLLFFLIALLEDTGYLARAAFVTDRVLRPFGLPGHAFVPLLSSHACALPGIIAARAVPDRRERLATILIAPFMSCTARIPVYVLLTGLLFPDRPSLAALAFTGCYVLGIFAGLLTAMLFRKTALRGESRPMALELPTFKWPSLRTAVLTAYDRGMIFLRKAGTVILAICIVLWWLETFPSSKPPESVIEWRSEAAQLAPDDPAAAQAMLERADRAENMHAKANSFAGRIGRTVEPIFRPLGYDWQLSIGIVTSFAAREVFVSTMAIVVTGEEADDPERLVDEIASARRDDGVTPIFTTATSWSLLVYYVLAMQCLPTLAVTARETGGIRWAAVQLIWMCGLAYLAAMVVYHAVA